MKDGIIKAAAVSPKVRPADCDFNAGQMIEWTKRAVSDGAKIIVFPELCITGYTCGDLFLQQTLLDGAEKALGRIANETAELDCILFVGLPVRYKNKLYNCAAAVCRGEMLGLVPKINIPNYTEFYEARYFSSGKDISAQDAFGFEHEDVHICGEYVPIHADMLFNCETMPGLIIGAEICEDLWVVSPPSDRLAASGATVIVNLSASDETIGKAAYRRQLIRSQSAKLLSAYIYSDAGFGESTQDMVFSGHCLIGENGSILSETRSYAEGMTVCDIDIGRLLHERQRITTYPAPELMHGAYFELEVSDTEIVRNIPSRPFVPADKTDLAERCEEILTMQASGLAVRMGHIGCKTAVIGLSGGLDSTLALIVTVRAFDILSLDRRGIISVTMPCFGTTKRTRSNAELLANAYGTDFREINISDSVRQHFADIGHDENIRDVTYENCQARERTQVLMDTANKTGGIVIGTGDLSELALGWATYNGDHMSMYGVNCSIPKTLVRYLVAYEAEKSGNELGDVLRDVLGTPVSPELLPPSENGDIAQKTEDIVGPYELHDFFMYYMLRFGFSPSKIFRLAVRAFDGAYDRAVIKKWLVTFVRRFFAQQFKRSCLPDGPKVGSVTLSPRGDWRMPSDACSSLWLKEAENIDL